MELSTPSTAQYLSFLEIIWLVSILEDSNAYLVPYENVGTVWLSIAICSVRYGQQFNRHSLKVGMY